MIGELIGWIVIIAFVILISALLISEARKKNLKAKLFSVGTDNNGKEEIKQGENYKFIMKYGVVISYLLFLPVMCLLSPHYIGGLVVDFPLPIIGFYLAFGVFSFLLSYKQKWEKNTGRKSIVTLMTFAFVVFAINLAVLIGNDGRRDILGWPESFMDPHEIAADVDKHLGARIQPREPSPVEFEAGKQKVLKGKRIWQDIGYMNAGDTLLVDNYSFHRFTLRQPHKWRREYNDDWVVVRIPFDTRVEVMLLPGAKVKYTKLKGKDKQT